MPVRQRTRVSVPIDACRMLLVRVVRGVERRVRGKRLPAGGEIDAAIHQLVGAPWPCPAIAQFESLWTNVIESLQARGLALGRGAFGGWDDADPALARAVWCLTVHLRPRVVIETGVARGLTTRIALEALERNGVGRLVSIDLPPSITRSPRLAEQVGAAVGPELYGRWTLLQGSSRRCLPSVVQGLAQLGQPVDLFIHDSLHTGRNVRFELDCVWPALSARGVALVDDIEQNAAFAAFTRRHRDATALVCEAEDGLAQFGCLLHASA